jgi:hypothetical protein
MKQAGTAPFHVPDTDRTDRKRDRSDDHADDHADVDAKRPTIETRKQVMCV